jgi:hypothetical protein
MGFVGLWDYFRYLMAKEISVIPRIPIIVVSTGIYRICGIVGLRTIFGNPGNPKNPNNRGQDLAWFSLYKYHVMHFFRNLRCDLARKQKLEGYSRR